jgi:hypothetical protein
MKVILSVPDEGYFERTWWKLFWAYLMKVILSVSDEGYFERIWWKLFWAYLMKVILSVSDEGYFERIWWRLFWAYLMKVILSVSDEGYFERTWWWLFWAYLMKVILGVPDEGYSRSAPCALHLISTFFISWYCVLYSAIYVGYHLVIVYLDLMVATVMENSNEQDNTYNIKLVVNSRIPVNIEYLAPIIISMCHTERYLHTFDIAEIRFWNNLHQVRAKPKYVN